MKKPLNSVLVKPAGPDCNMACRYCFYLEKSELFSDKKVHRMSEEVLEEMVKQVMQGGGQHVSFGWQGGEPTLMGLEFFEKAVRFQQQFGYRQYVGNGLQTNGILINQDWAKFLREYSFLVGLSIDGPQHIHNKYRFLRNGKGSWKKISDKAKLMLDNGVEVNALTVLNNYSVKFPEEIYDFHKSMGLNFMQFIPCVETEPENPEKILPFTVKSQDFGEFLKKVFDLWISDFRNGEPTTFIRFFDSVFHSYVDVPPPECTLLDECGIYVVVEHNGNIYSCDFFVEPDWYLGNVLEDKIPDMLNSRRQKEFGLIKSRLPEECLNCRWVKHCRGGCPKDRLVKTETGNLNFLCAGFKIFFEHSDAKFKELARQWKIKNEEAAKREQVRQAIAEQGIKVNRNDPCPCGSGKKFKYCCGE